MLRSLYVDLNSYLASVEQQLRPELSGKPVGVLPVLADTTCCIAARIDAKRYELYGLKLADLNVSAAPWHSG